MSELFAVIKDRIAREKDKILGLAVSIPYITTVNAQNTWVVDVMTESNFELLTKVPFAEINRSVRNFVTLNTPVEMQRSKTGQYYVVGLSGRKKDAIIKKTYSVINEGLAFTQGWKLDGSLNWESGNNNSVSGGTEQTINFTYTSSFLTYGELIYGTTVYGATKTTRTP